MASWDENTQKYMDNKFQVLSNIYFDVGYLVSFIYLENMIVLYPLVS